MFPVHTILHPTDFSPSSEYAFRVACTLAREQNARLIVLHVAPPLIVFGEMVPPVHPDDYRGKMKEALERLRATTPSSREVTIESRLEMGEPAPEIVTVAKEVGAGLIVMGSHGRTGLMRLLLGSVAEHVLRRASCPVLTIKAPVATDEPIAEDKATAKTCATCAH